MTAARRRDYLKQSVYALTWRMIGWLGETAAMSDATTGQRYGIALPDNRQYRGLVNRLPALAKERLRLAVFWVSREHDELIVEVES